MKIDREKLVAAIGRVKPALQNSGSIPALKNIWMDGKYMYAYNGAMGIRIDWPLKIAPCGISGATLLGLLESSKVTEIEFDQSAKTQTDLKIGRASAVVPIMPHDFTPWPFPAKVPAGPVGVRTLKLSKELIEGLKLVRAIKATKPNRVEHYGVVLFPSKDFLALYTTDSLALAEVRVKGKASKDLAKTVLPHDFVTQLLGLKDATVSFTQDAIIVEDEGIQVCSNLLDNSSVWDLPKLVDQKIEGHGDPTPLPKEFSEALNRALVLAGSDLGKAYLRLSTNKKELVLAGNFDGGSLEEKFTLSKSAEQARISVSLEQLKGLHRDAAEFAISDHALVLFGKGESLFMIAVQEEKK